MRNAKGEALIGLSRAGRNMSVELAPLAPVVYNDEVRHCRASHAPCSHR